LRSAGLEVRPFRDEHIRRFGEGGIEVCRRLGKGGCLAAGLVGDEGGGGLDLAAVVDRADKRGRHPAGNVSDSLVDRGGAKGGGARDLRPPGNRGGRWGVYGARAGEGWWAPRMGRGWSWWRRG